MASHELINEFFRMIRQPFIGVNLSGCCEFMGALNKHLSRFVSDL